MDCPQTEPLTVMVPLPVLSLADPEAFTLIEQLEEPTVKPPVMIRVTEVVVPLSDALSDNATLGSPLNVTPFSLQPLMVSTILSDAEVEVSV